MIQLQQVKFYFLVNRFLKCFRLNSLFVSFVPSFNMVLKFKVQRSNKSALKLFRHQNIKATYILTHELPIIQHFSFPFFTPMQCKYLTGSFRTQIIKSFHWNDYTRYFTQFSQRAKVSKACLSSKSFFFVLFATVLKLLQFMLRT